MAAVTREQLHSMIDDLAEDRLVDAQEALDRLASMDSARRRRQVIQSLRDDGLIVSEPPRLSVEERQRLRERPLIKLEGESIAETVVRNREPVG